MDTEKIWKDIIGYEGIYKISNQGDVLSLERTVVCKNGNPQYTPEILMKHNVNSKGYYRVPLCKNGTKKWMQLHRLLAIHFIPNPNNYPIVRHLNDNKLDFKLENLAWGTNKDNTQDAIKNGKGSQGEKNPMYGRRGKDAPGYGKTGDKNPMFGKTRGKCKRARIVLNTQTGIFYDCIADAADSIGSKYGTLASKLRGHDRNNTPLIYV